MLKLRKQLARLRAPITIGLVAIGILGTVYSLLFSAQNPGISGWVYLGFSPRAVAAHPWSLFTYPLQGDPPAMSILSAWLIYQFGAQTEREMQPAKFALIVTGAWVLTPLASLLALSLTGLQVGIASLAFVAAHIAFAWALTHRYSQVMLFMLIPVPGYVLGWLAVLLAAVIPALSAPVAIPVLVAPFAATWYLSAVPIQLARRTSRNSRAARRIDYEGIDWEKRRQAETERRKLKELLERSYGDRADDGNEPEE